MADLSLSVRAIEKLVDYAAIGVGAVAGPMLANWKASKEGRARLTYARFDADVRRAEAESRGESLVVIAEAQAKARQSIDATMESGRGIAEITAEDITQSIEFQGRKRLANVASVVEDAADDLGNKEVPDHEPDPDWTARFFDCVQDVSSEDMQKLWSRILAGEVESHGRTSLRTLDTLKNMTKRDAEEFRDICSFILAKDFVFYDPQHLHRYRHLEYNKLLHLQDCGLLNVGPNLVKSIKWRSRKISTFTYHVGVLLIDGEQSVGEELKIPEVILTTAGKELSQFVPSSLQMEYLQRFSTFLESKNCKLSYLEGVVPLANGMLHYEKSTLIEPNAKQSEGNPS